MGTRAEFDVSAEARAVLGRAEIEADLVRLSSSDAGMDPGLYREVDKVLQAAGGKWNRKRHGHAFAQGDPRAKLARFLAGGKAVNEKTLKQAFYTPAALARRVVRTAEFDGLQDPLVLEPSAGQGALVQAILEAAPSAVVDCVELDATCQPALGALTAGSVTTFDFLTMRPVPGFRDYDRIVMNPPFSDKRDIDHVVHAFQFLAPGGLLVAIMSAGAVKGATSLHKKFDRLLLDVEGTWEELEPGAFRESGTNVNAILVKLRKPVVQGAPVYPRAIPVRSKARG